MKDIVKLLPGGRRVTSGLPETVRLTALLPGSFLNSTNSFVVISSGLGVRVKPGPMETL